MAAIAAASLLTPALTFSAPASAATGTARASFAMAGARLHLKLVSASNGAFEIQSAYPDGVGHNYCLDANDAGSSAGKNGDKVQLWACTGNFNQMWYAVDEVSGGYWQLENDEFPSECLNANDTGGLGNGSRAQLWSCTVYTGNEYWDYTHWSSCTVGGTTYCELAVEAGNNLCLNANSSDVSNGDYVQVWSCSATGDADLWT
jgi:hypothetical protein